jgi:hypothetical protein
VKAFARRGIAAVRGLRYRRTRYPRPLGSRPRFALAVCGIFKNEARYLAEWVTFHRLQGAERLWLYDNQSDDDWQTALAPELASGVVTVTPWPHEAGQRAAYADCLERHRDDARWIAFLDADEFLFSPTGRSLPDVLSAFDMHPGVVVNWRLFGSNGRQHPPEGLVIESYPIRAADDNPANVLVKSVVYPRMTLGPFQSAHYFRLRGNPVGEDGRPVLLQTREPPTADLLRINHYYAKSAEEFRRKSRRPNPTDGMVQERFPDPEGAVRDDAILQFAPALKKALDARATSPSRV